jgi:hypothetical protein
MVLKVSRKLAMKHREKRGRFMNSLRLSTEMILMKMYLKRDSDWGIYL